MTWTDRVPDAVAHARAGGRARYNHERQLLAAARMPLVVRRYMELHAAPGAKAQIAREWNLHRSTITRDIQRWSGIEAWQCPVCLQLVRHDDWIARVEVRDRELPDNPLSDANQDRMRAISAIRAELPRVLADLNIFEADDGAGSSYDPEEPRIVLAELMDDIATRVADRARDAA